MNTLKKVLFAKFFFVVATYQIREIFYKRPPVEEMVRGPRKVAF